MKASRTEPKNSFMQSLRSPAPRAALSRSQSGQALIELAFVVPLLLTLVLGVIEIGRYAYIAILIGNAAHAGAKYGAQGHQQSDDTAGIQNAAQYDFSGALDDTTNTNGLVGSQLKVTSFTTCGCDSAGTVTTAGCTTDTNLSAGTCVIGRWVVVVTVTASGKFDALFKYPGIPTPLIISRTASMPVI
jgi:Flp pilus assembly protein TadG